MDPFPTSRATWTTSARASGGRPWTPAAAPTTSGSSPSPRRSAWTTSGPLQRQDRRTSAKTASRKLYRKSTGSADLTIRWHLIGTLQSNKVRKAVPRFSAIHSVDSRRLLDAIDAAATDAGTTPELLVQVDLARRGDQARRDPSDEAMDIVRAAASCRSARCVGLMTIPPFFEQPGRRAAVLRPLRALRRYTPERGSRPGDAAGVVYGHEPRLRNRRAGRSHDCSARHGHLRETPCLIRSHSIERRSSRWRPPYESQSARLSPAPVSHRVPRFR